MVLNMFKYVLSQDAAVVGRRIGSLQRNVSFTRRFLVTLQLLRVEALRNQFAAAQVSDHSEIVLTSIRKATNELLKTALVYRNGFTSLEGMIVIQQPSQKIMNEVKNPNKTMISHLGPIFQKGKRFILNIKPALEKMSVNVGMLPAMAMLGLALV